MSLVVTNQAPSAKPISVFIPVPSSYTNLITVDEYEIPVTGFAAETRIAPGVAEVTSPVTVSNTSSETETFDLRILRDNTEVLISNQFPVEPNEIMFVPLNGHFFLSETSDTLQIRASTGGALTVMLSFTQGQAEEDDAFVG